MSVGRKVEVSTGIAVDVAIKVLVGARVSVGTGVAVDMGVKVGTIVTVKVAVGCVGMEVIVGGAFGKREPTIRILNHNPPANSATAKTPTTGHIQTRNNADRNPDFCLLFPLGSGTSARSMGDA